MTATEEQPLGLGNQPSEKEGDASRMSNPSEIAMKDRAAAKVLTAWFTLD